MINQKLSTNVKRNKLIGNKIPTKSTQHGMTGIAIAMILMMVGFFAFIGLKLFPIYMESFKVNSALSSLATDKTLATSPTRTIVTKLMKRLDIDDVDNVTRKEISVEKTSNGVMVYVEYEVEKPLTQNMSIIVYFDKEVELIK